jgi:hypothetical protein
LAVWDQVDKQLAACRAEMLVQLRETDIVTDDFHKLREQRVALTLGEAVRSIVALRIPGGEFHSSFPDESLVAIRNSITSQR